MTQFDDFGMRDFLDSINECCEDFTQAWSTSNLDVSALKELKAKLNQFALRNKDTILSFYTYASGKGRYVQINYRPLLDIMCKYDEYHDDLMTYIKSILSDKKMTEGEGEANTAHVEEAARTDESFRESLFGELEQVTFPVTIRNLDAFMGLYAFIDKAYDNFIYLSRKEDVSPKAKILINLYANSVISFLQKMLFEITGYISHANRIMHGEKEVIAKATERQYKLI